MATIEELKRQRDLLRAKKQNQMELMMIQKERNKLKMEISRLKNPASDSFKSNLKKGLSIGGRATFRFLDQITRPAPMRGRGSKGERVALRVLDRKTRLAPKRKKSMKKKKVMKRKKRK